MVSDETTGSVPVPMVNVQIDGEWVEVPKGTRMIEACRQAGVAVPHYCYHPKLSSPGNCRMCLVEMGMPPRVKPGDEAPKDADGKPVIQWLPRPAISCANTVTEGMGIRTQSKLTKECRETVMEFLLANHPLDCPICDQAGECELQEYSVEHGRGGSRFFEDKTKKPKNVRIGERIRFDGERCILCSRCVRFMDEVAEEPVLGIVDRGGHSTIAVHPEHKLDSNYSLNTADLCPVGALTSNDFRFQMRVWFLKETESICTGCARGCNTVISSRQEQVYRQTPRRNDEVNSDWMCDRGRLDFHYLSDERRLAQPMVRDVQTRRHDPVNWEKAFAALLEGVRSHSAKQIAVVASARMTNEELFLLKKILTRLNVGKIGFVERLGEADDYLVTADRNPNSKGVQTIFGADVLIDGVNSVRRGIGNGEVKALLVWGEDLGSPEVGFATEDLSKLDFFAVAGLRATPANELADVILPTAGFAEKNGTMINVTGRIQLLKKATESPGEARDDLAILCEIWGGLDGEKVEPVARKVYELLSAEIGIFSLVNWEDITGGGYSIYPEGEVAPLLLRERERKSKGVIVG